MNNTKVSITTEEYNRVRDLCSLNLSRCGIHHNSYLSCLALECNTNGRLTYKGFKKALSRFLSYHNVQLDGFIKSLVLTCYLMAINNIEVPKGTVTEYLKTKELGLEVMYGR